MEGNLETISKQCSGADISKTYLLFILITLVLSSQQRHDIWDRRYSVRWRTSQMQMVGKGPEITIWFTLYVQSQPPADPCELSFRESLRYRQALCSFLHSSKFLWGEWCPERLTILHKVSDLLRDGAGIQTPFCHRFWTPFPSDHYSNTICALVAPSTQAHVSVSGEFPWNSLTSIRNCYWRIALSFLVSFVMGYYCLFSLISSTAPLVSDCLFLMRHPVMLEDKWKT